MRRSIEERAEVPVPRGLVSLEGEYYKSYEYIRVHVIPEFDFILSSEFRITRGFRQRGVLGLVHWRFN